jgi:2-dehydro-3-deoxyphosphogluconate aldolase/(4S)-4-hydroxy-2-oxoglutarate aldolase
MLARNLGAEALKLFPASWGGPAYMKALLGPFPTTQFVPTGGVTPENAGEWFAAGAVAVGAGGALAPDTLEALNRADVIRAARRFTAGVREGRARAAEASTWTPGVA